MHGLAGLFLGKVFVINFVLHSYQYLATCDLSYTGLSLRVAYFPDEVEILKAEAEHDLKSALNAIKLKDRGKQRPNTTSSLP
jgi:hypothetical protein